MSKQKAIQMTAEELRCQYAYMEKVGDLLQSRYAHMPTAFVHSYGCPFVSV